MEDYLSMGSIVELKQDELSDMVKDRSLKSFRVMITQRMAALDEAPVYYNYGAVIYPFGTFKGYESIYFGPELIDRIIFEGYRDDTDIALIAALKTEYLFKRDYTSFRFAKRQVRQQALKEIQAQRSGDE